MQLLNLPKLKDMKLYKLNIPERYRDFLLRYIATENVEKSMQESNCDTKEVEKLLDDKEIMSLVISERAALIEVQYKTRQATYDRKLAWLYDAAEYAHKKKHWKDLHNTIQLMNEMQGHIAPTKTESVTINATARVEEILNQYRKDI